MLPADVGAAPAAATRYQPTSSSTAPAARRERQASDADPFGELVDQCAADTRAPSASGQRPARPAARQAATAPPQALAPAQDASGTGSTTPGVKNAQGCPDDEPPAAPAAKDADRTDLVVPQTVTPFEVPRPVPAAGGIGSDVASTVAGASPQAGTPVVPGHWQQPVALPATAVTPFDASQGDATLLDTGDVDALLASSGSPLADLQLPDGMPPEAASPEVLAALRAVRATGSPDIGAAVSSAASSRAARPDAAPDPAASPDPRGVAMAAVREALAQAVNGNGTEIGQSATSLPEADPAPQAPRAAADRVMTPGATHAGVPVPPGDAPFGEAPMGAVAPQTTQASQPADPALTPAVGADATTSGAAPLRTPRPARQASAQAQMAVSNLPAGADAGTDDSVASVPGRKTTHDDAPVLAARPTARAAQAIAAFHAAAAIGAGTTPAAVNAAVTSTGVSSTPLLDAELPTQLIQAIRVQFDQGSGEARIRLNPGFLGGVTVGVQIDGSSVTASLQAASADVREWMRTNESVLRQALADQGLQLDRLVIVDDDAPASSEEHDARPGDEREQQAPRRQRRTADQGTFELVF